MSAPLPDSGDTEPDAARRLADAIDALAGLKASAPLSGYGDRLDAFEKLSDRLLSGSGATVPGAAFLAAFLRRGHMEQLLNRELPALEALDRFVSAGSRSELRIFPRGSVCHWIAGNVPLLGVFSWALSAVFGNVNLIRVSSRGDDVLSPVVERVREVSDAGREMAERTRVVHFSRDNGDCHATMSRFADLRVAWGGEEAVSAVKSLPARWECDDLVFGPRRSYAIVDPAVVDDGMITRLANDIVYFDQLACSSPQVVFVKASGDAALMDDFATRIAAAVDSGAKRFARHALDWGETYLIELDRQRAVLEGGRVHRDDSTQWTVAVLDEPVGHITCANRFVQLVPYERVDSIAEFLPQNVQTITMALTPQESHDIAEQLGRRGVCRFPGPGLGNSFEIPWDGIAVAPRLGHWVTRATR